MFDYKAVMNSIKNLEWKKYFYKNLLICSLVVFFVFFIITIVLTNGYTTAVENEFDRYSREVVFNIKDNTKKTLDIFSDCYSRLVGGCLNDITIAACSDDMTSPLVTNSISEIRNTIDSYRADGGQVDSIYFYLPKGKYVISNNTNFPNNYSDVFLDNEWINEYEKTEKNFSVRNVKSRKINKSYFTVIRTVNLDGYNNLIAYNIDIDKFFSSINTELAEFYLIDENNNIIYEKNGELTGSNLKKVGEKGEKILRAITNTKKNIRENTVLIPIDVGSGKHKIVVGIDSAEYNQQYQRIRNILIVIIFVVILLTIVLAFFIVSEFYNNIFELVMIIDGKERKSKRNLYEITFVKNKILAMLDKNAKIENELANRISLVSKTQKDVLQSQLNSHFLYNTLGLISAIDILENKRDTNTVKAISAFSEILRFAMNRESYTAPLSEELNFMRKYLEIQRFRYKDRFDYDEEIDEALLDANIIKMILQPLIENAIFHGIVPSGRKCSLRIKVYEENNMMKVQVLDTGVGITEKKMQEICRELKKGIDSDVQTHGLISVHQRCVLFYGPEYGCEIECENGVTCVTVKHPIFKKNDKEDDEIEE